MLSRCVQAATDLSMQKVLLILLILCLSLTGHNQTSDGINRLLHEIRSIPPKYTENRFKFKKHSIINTPADVYYRIVLNYSTTAIPFLIEKLSDTTLTNIKNMCSQEIYSIGDISFLLINDIEQIPYAAVTNFQWCLIGLCGFIPDGFMLYLKYHRQEFQSNYKAYYYSQTRQSILKEKRKWYNFNSTYAIMVLLNAGLICISSSIVYLSSYSLASGILSGFGINFIINYKSVRGPGETFNEDPAFSNTWRCVLYYLTPQTFDNPNDTYFNFRINSSYLDDWCLHGIFIKNTPIKLANGITATLSGIIFYLKLTSKSNAKN